MKWIKGNTANWKAQRAINDQQIQLNKVTEEAIRGLLRTNDIQANTIKMLSERLDILERRHES